MRLRRSRCFRKPTTVFEKLLYPTALDRVPKDLIVDVNRFALRLLAVGRANWQQVQAMQPWAGFGALRFFQNARKFVSATDAVTVETPNGQPTVQKAAVYDILATDATGCGRRRPFERPEAIR